MTVFNSCFSVLIFDNISGSSIGVGMRVVRLQAGRPVYPGEK